MSTQFFEEDGVYITEFGMGKRAKFNVGIQITVGNDYVQIPSDVALKAARAIVAYYEKPENAKYAGEEKKEVKKTCALCGKLNFDQYEYCVLCGTAISEAGDAVCRIIEHLARRIKALEEIVTR